MYLQGYKEDVDAVSGEISRLHSLLAGMVPQVLCDTVSDQLKLSQGEVVRLRKALESTVPLVKLQEVEDEARRAAQELESMRQRLKGMVPQDELQRARGLLEDLAAESQRLQRQLEDARAAAKDAVEKAARDRAEAARLQALLAATVPKPQHEAALTQLEEARGEVERLTKAMETMVPRSQLLLAQDESARQSAEAARLQKQIANEMVFKAELAAALDEAKRLRQEVEALKAAAAAREAQLASLRAEIKAVKDDLDQKTRELVGCVPRVELGEAKAEAGRARQAAEELAQDKTALEAMLAGLKARLVGMVPKEQLDAAREEAARYRDELAVLLRRLAAAGLSDPKLLDRLLTALCQPPSDSPVDAINLLERVKASNGVMLPELCLFLDLLSEAEMLLPDVRGLLSDLRAPVPRTVQEARRMVNVMNQPAPLSVEDLAALRALLRGPPPLSIDALKQLLLACPSLEDLQRMLAELDSLRRQLAEAQREAQRLKAAADALASDLAARVPAAPVVAAPLSPSHTGSASLSVLTGSPSAFIYCTTDGTEPTPTNFEHSGRSPLELSLQQSCILKARVEDHRELSAVAEQRVVVAAPRERERSAPRTGGVGMLIERFQDDGHIVVKSLIPGGAADQDGRIQPGDYLLAVDGQVVGVFPSETVVRMIAGPEGTTVDLRLMRTAEDGSSEAPGGGAFGRSGPRSARGLEYVVTLARCESGFIGPPNGATQRPADARRRSSSYRDEGSPTHPSASSANPTVGSPNHAGPRRSHEASIYRPFFSVFEGGGQGGS